MANAASNGSSKGTDHIEVFGRKVDKIARFGWTIRDMPGRFRMIDKDDLEVDESYQREETAEKVTAIASSWSWMGCGVLLVAHRQGRYFVMDGSHRVGGARKRSDIQMLPCFVFETDDAATEANGFLQSNTLRKPVSAVEKFKAKVLIGRPESVLTARLIEGSGYFVKKSPDGRSVRCVAAIEKWATQDPETLEAVWPLVVECSKGGAIQQTVVASLCYTERRLKAVNPDASLLRKPWVDRLRVLGAQGIHDAAVEGAKYHGKGGERSWARGLVNILNRGLRNRLDIGETD